MPTAIEIIKKIKRKISWEKKAEQRKEIEQKTRKKE